MIQTFAEHFGLFRHNRSPLNQHLGSSRRCSDQPRSLDFAAHLVRNWPVRRVLRPVGVSPPSILFDKLYEGRTPQPGAAAAAAASEHCCGPTMWIYPLL